MTAPSLRPGLFVVLAAFAAGCSDGSGPTDSANRPPSVAIVSPADGAGFLEGETVSFRATATDPEDGNLGSEVAWTSSRDGSLGTGSTLDATLSVGAHDVTARVTDSEGSSASASISLTVEADAPPSVTITSPGDGISVPEEVVVSFTATATDEVDGDVSDRIAWSSDVDGLLGEGDSIATRLSQGEHTVTAEVTDGGGQASAASIQVQVTPPSPGTVVARIHVNGASPTLAELEISGEAQVVLGGARDAQGLPARLTEFVVGEPDLEADGRAVVELDEQSRLTFVGDPENGSLEIAYTSPDTARVTWTPPGGGPAYEVEVELGSSAAAAAGSSRPASGASAQDLPERGEVLVTCGPEGPGQAPVPHAQLNVVGRYPIPGPTPGFRYESLDVSPLGGGRFEYAIPSLGSRVSLQDSEAGLLQLLSDICTETELVRLSASLPNRLETLTTAGAAAAGGLLRKVTRICLGSRAWSFVSARADQKFEDRIDILGVGRIPGGTPVWKEWSITTADRGVPQETLNLGADVCSDADLAGSWTGTLRQDDLSPSLFRYSVVLNQSGTSVSGTSRIATTGQPREFRQATAAGQVRTNLLDLRETGVTSSDPPEGVEWCTLESTELVLVSLANGDDVLRGTGTAPGCAASRIQLRRAARFLPTVSIDAPDPGHTVAPGEAITFRGSARDAGNADISAGIEWYSDQVAGPLGRGAEVEVVLPPGTHRILAIAMDYFGDTQPQPASFTVRVADGAPTVAIERPADGTSVVEGTEITLEARAEDPEDGELSGAVEWDSSRDGPLGTGASLDVVLSVGTHTVTASVTDSEGTPAADAVSVKVLANEPPVVSITSPPGGTSVEEGTPLTFTGTATDPEDGDLTAALEWSSDLDGLLGTGGSVEASLSPGTHAVTASATDGAGATGTAAVAVEVTPGSQDDGGELVNGQNHDGSVSPAFDQDVWTFDADAGDYIALRIAETAEVVDFRPSIRLISPSGALVRSSSGRLVGQIDATAAETGTYRVEVESARPSAGADPDGVGDYRIRLVKAPGAFEVPAGDQGGELVNGTHPEGAVELGDLDAWSFQANAGDYLALRIAELSEEVDFRPWIRLISPSGNLIRGSSGHLVGQIDATAPSSGTYTVIVGSARPSAGAEMDGIGTYRLSFIQAPGSAQVPAGDEGGTLANGTRPEGSIPLGDLDAWSFQANAGDYLALRIAELSEQVDFRPWIRLISPSGNLIRGSSGHLVGQIDATAPSSGTYTVIVGSARPSAGAEMDGIGDYRLTLVQVPGSFSVPSGDEGGSLGGGGSRSGTISLGDLDPFTVSVSEGDTLTVEIVETAEMVDFRPWIRLVSPSGALERSTSGSTEADLTFIVPQDADYTIIVGSNRPSAGAEMDGIGSYSLTATVRTGAGGVSPPG